MVYGIQMIGSIILARLLSPSDFGLVAMVTIITAITIEFGILRLSDATIQREDINHDQVSTLFWINVLLCLAIAIILSLLSPMFVRVYGDERLQAIVYVFAISFIFHGLSVQHLAILQRRMQFFKFAGNQIFATIFSIGVAIIMALQGWGYWSIVGRQVLLIIMITIGAWVLCPWRPGLPKMSSGITPLVKFGLNSFGSYLMGYIHRSLDKFLLGWQHGPQLLGYYERAYHLFVIPVNQLVNPLTSLAVSTLSRLNDEPLKFKSYYLNAIAMLAFIGMPLSAVLTLIGNDLIIILLGPKWEHAGKVLTAFCPSIGIQLLYNTNAWLHLSSGNADRLFKWSSSSIIVFASLFLLGVQHGAVGVAIAYASAYYLLLLPALWFAGRPLDIHLSDILPEIWKQFLSSLFSGVIVWYICFHFHFTSPFICNLNVYLSMLLRIFFCLLFYILFIILLFRGTKPINVFLTLIKDMSPNFSK